MRLLSVVGSKTTASAAKQAKPVSDSDKRGLAAAQAGRTTAAAVRPASVHTAEIRYGVAASIGLQALCGRGTAGVVADVIAAGVMVADVVSVAWGESLSSRLFQGR